MHFGASKRSGNQSSSSMHGYPPGTEAPSDPMKGSYEGYMNSSPAYVQANGVGYDNPANQQARYKGKTSSTLGDTPSFTPISNNPNNSGIIDNYSSTFKRDSSGDRLSQMRNVEGMF
ncbi:hypothetical protein [Flavobacterium sp.]|uniref:hypothetical protein n=1 Tax=Flavobacterium sp. TaxID=239 RepID=UPI003BC47BE3